MTRFQQFTVLFALAATGICEGRLCGLEITLPTETVQMIPSSLPGYAYASGFCVTCHSADYPKYQPPALSKAFWQAEVAKMKKVYGAPIPDEAVNPIADYLAKTYGAEAQTSPANQGK